MGDGRIFLKTSAPHSFMTTYWIKLLSARSISLDSTFKFCILSVFYTVRENNWYCCIRFTLQSRGSGPNYGGIFVAGCVGGAVQLSIACPVELIKGKNHSQNLYFKRDHWSYQFDLNAVLITDRIVFSCYSFEIDSQIIWSSYCKRHIEIIKGGAPFFKGVDSFSHSWFNRQIIILKLR